MTFNHGASLCILEKVGLGEIMVSRGLLGKLSFLSVLLPLYGCAGYFDDANFESRGGAVPTPARYSWMLPKTVLTATATITLISCDEALREAKVATSVTLSSNSEPDTYLGPDYPDGVISLRPEDLKSFWQDRNITIKVGATTHILASIGSQPVNQVGAIAANVITSATKLAAVAYGVPAVGALAARSYCGPAYDVLKTIQSDKDKLISANVSPNDIKDLPNQIQSIQPSLSISVQKKIDPNNIPYRDGRRRLWIASLAPTKKQIEDSTWFADKAAADDFAGKLAVDVYLNLEKAYPREALDRSIQCGERGCYLRRVPVAKGTLYREVAYMPVEVDATSSGRSTTVLSKTFPFGQFGVPRVLPLSAGLFENLSWSVSFADTGEITDAQFGSKAIGVAATSLLGSAASAANSIATESRNASVALDSSTVRLQNENAALKAQIDNINYTQQLNALLASSAHK
ncbi:hypothetical protein MXD81_31365 [Microbacteriaceae bacterium K1510]|nr:hypothetical protein [Microbacteriaceae bacterium K1510]